MQELTYVGKNITDIDISKYPGRVCWHIYTYIGTYIHVSMHFIYIETRKLSESPIASRHVICEFGCRVTLCRHFIASRGG